MRTMRLHAADNVEVLTEPARIPSADGMAAVQPGHKIATTDLAKGDPVIKYGHLIGIASDPIRAGDHVHTHNLESVSAPDNYRLKAELSSSDETVGTARQSHFLGYHRLDGSVGTRNYIALCATVNCSSTVVHRAADLLNNSDILRNNPEFDGVFAVAHNSGCGMATTGIGADILDRVLWGYATHPNVAAAIFVGLGCEVMQVARMQRRLSNDSGSRVHTLTIQETGGTTKTIEAIVAKVKELIATLGHFKREEAPISALKVGLQCGGSDAFSGMSANPALGYASDRIAALGGAPVLSETPEIFGAESLLLSRTPDEAVADRLKQKIEWWQRYVADHGADLNNNPSPGNKAGGLTTILEKSLGAVAKSGRSPLKDVIAYGEKITTPGLNFMDTPGFDPVSVTGQIAGGCQLICFTTGRGSAFGSKPAPTIKIASNSRLFHEMGNDMDIGCGDMISDGVAVQDKGSEIFDLIVQTASGRKTKSEQLGLGEYEFVPWHIGAVL